MDRLFSLRGSLGWLALFCLASCSWTQVPETDEAVVSPRQLEVGPNRDEGATLYPVDAGYWVSVRDEDRERGLEAETGDLLAYRTSNTRRRHPPALFVAVASRSWGVLLQRLDVGAVRDLSMRGRLIPVDLSNRTRLRLDAGSICMGSGPFDDNECLASTPPGRRWAVYRRDETGLIGRGELSDDGFVLERARMLHRSIFDETWQTFGGDGAPVSDWLAVPLPGRFADPPGGTVQVGGDCNVGASRLESIGISVERTSMREFPTHPVAVEARAYASMVDAIATCSGERLSVVGPAFFRAEASTLRGSSLGPTMLGMEPIRIAGLSSRQRARLIGAVVAMARGDAVVAEARLARLFETVGYGRLESLVLRSAQVAAAAGRPETALRWAEFGSSSRWNRTADPLYALGRATAQRAFGYENAFASRLLETEQLAGEMAGSKHRRAWLEWTAFRLAPRDGRSSRGLEELARTFRDRDLSLWSLGIQLERLQRGDLSGDRPLGHLRDRADSHGVRPLVSAIRGRDVARDCPTTGDCSIDVYGRRLASSLKHIEDDRRFAEYLVQSGRARVRPGFDARRLLDDPPAFARLSLVAPLLSGLDSQTRRTFGELVASEMKRDGFCEGTASTWRPPYFEMTRRNAPLEGRSTAELGRLLQWFYSIAPSSLCRHADRSAEQLRRLADEHSELAPVIGPMLMGLFEQTERGRARSMILEEAARFAGRYDSGEACKTRHLALAAAYADANRLEEAESHLGDALNCRNVSENASLDRIERTITGYVSFERSRSFPRDLEDEIEVELERVLRLRRSRLDCIGLESFQYDLLDHLPGEVGRLATALDLERRESEGSALELQTSSMRIAAANRALDQVRARLEAGRRDADDEEDDATANGFSSPVEPLLRAHAIYRRHYHQPGLATTSFLSQQLFGVPVDQLESWSRPEAETCEERPEMLTDEGLSIPTSPTELRCLVETGGARRVLEQLDSRDWTQWSESRRHSALALVLLLDRREARTYSSTDLATSSTLETLCSTREIESPIERVEPATSFGETSTSEQPPADDETARP